MADLESWRFDLALAEIEAALMDDAELQKQFGKHLNYIPGSSVGSSRVDLQACKLEYSIVSPK